MAGLDGCYTAWEECSEGWRAMSAGAQGNEWTPLALEGCIRSDSGWQWSWHPFCLCSHPSIKLVDIGHLKFLNLSLHQALAEGITIIGGGDQSVSGSALIWPSPKVLCLLYHSESMFQSFCTVRRHYTEEKNDKMTCHLFEVRFYIGLIENHCLGFKPFYCLVCQKALPIGNRNKRNNFV